MACCAHSRRQHMLLTGCACCVACRLLCRRATHCTHTHTHTHTRTHTHTQTWRSAGASAT
jgi:hypothetical protein